MLGIGDPEVEIGISVLIDDVGGVGGADSQYHGRPVGALSYAVAVRFHRRRQGNRTDAFMNRQRKTRVTLPVEKSQLLLI